MAKARQALLYGVHGQSAAPDHLAFTTTDGQVRGDSGLTLLRPGLEAAGVEVEPVPFRPEDATVPEPLPVDLGDSARFLI